MIGIHPLYHSFKSSMYAELFYQYLVWTHTYIHTDYIDSLQWPIILDKSRVVERDFTGPNVVPNNATLWPLATTKGHCPSTPEKKKKKEQLVLMHRPNTTCRTMINIIPCRWHLCGYSKEHVRWLVRASSNTKEGAEIHWKLHYANRISIH